MVVDGGPEMLIMNGDKESLPGLPDHKVDTSENVNVVFRSDAIPMGKIKEILIEEPLLIADKNMPKGGGRNRLIIENGRDVGDGALEDLLSLMTLGEKGPTEEADLNCNQSAEDTRGPTIALPRKSSSPIFQDFFEGIRLESEEQGVRDRDQRHSTESEEDDFRYDCQSELQERGPTMAGRHNRNVCHPYRLSTSSRSSSGGSPSSPSSDSSESTCSTSLGTSPSPYEHLSTQQYCRSNLSGSGGTCIVQACAESTSSSPSDGSGNGLFHQAHRHLAGGGIMEAGDFEKNASSSDEASKAVCLGSGETITGLPVVAEDQLGFFSAVAPFAMQRPLGESFLKPRTAPDDSPLSSVSRLSPATTDDSCANSPLSYALSPACSVSSRDSHINYPVQTIGVDLNETFLTGTLSGYGAEVAATNQQTLLQPAHVVVDANAAQPFSGVQLAGQTSAAVSSGRPSDLPTPTSESEIRWMCSKYEVDGNDSFDDIPPDGSDISFDKLNVVPLERGAEANMAAGGDPKTKVATLIPVGNCSSTGSPSATQLYLMAIVNASVVVEPPNPPPSRTSSIPRGHVSPDPKGPCVVVTHPATVNSAAATLLERQPVQRYRRLLPKTDPTSSVSCTVTPASSDSHHIQAFGASQAAFNWAIPSPARLKNNQVAKEKMRQAMDVVKKNRAMLSVDTKAVNLNKDEDGDTNLHISVLNNDLEMVYAIVESLVQRKESIDIRNKNKQTPLYVAASRNHPLLVEYLIESGSNSGLPCKKGNTPLHVAAKNGDRFLEVGRLLCESYDNVNHSNCDGFTPLHLAVMSHQLVGSLEFIRMLLAHGASLDLKMRSGKTALHFAIEEGSVDLVTVLCKACDRNDAAINCRTSNGDCPLHYAAAANSLPVQTQMEIIKVLLEHGANKGLKNKEGSGRGAKSLVDKTRQEVRKLL